MPKCIERLKELMNWDEGQRIEIDGRKIRAKGISCIWKTSTFDTNATSGVIAYIHFHSFRQDLG
jgi:hypothetical protein